MELDISEILVMRLLLKTGMLLPIKRNYTTLASIKKYVLSSVGMEIGYRQHFHIKKINV